MSDPSAPAPPPKDDGDDGPPQAPELGDRPSQPTPYRQPPPQGYPTKERKTVVLSGSELTALLIKNLQSRPEMQQIVKEYQLRKELRINIDDLRKEMLDLVAGSRQEVLKMERDRSAKNIPGLISQGLVTKQQRISAFKEEASKISLLVKEYKSGTPMTYRGDGRSPWIILMSGFYTRSGGSGPRLAAKTLQKIALQSGHIESWMQDWRTKQQSDGVDIISTGPGGAKAESMGGSNSRLMYAISLEGLSEYAVNAQTLGIDRYAIPASAGSTMAKTLDRLLLNTNSLDTATEIAIKAHGGVGEISFLTNIPPSRIKAFTTVGGDLDIGWIEFSPVAINQYRELLIKYGLHDFTE